MKVIKKRRRGKGNILVDLLILARNERIVQRVARLGGSGEEPAATRKEKELDFLTDQK